MGPPDGQPGDPFVPVAPVRRSSQIVARIQTAIDEGRLAVGDRLPNERDLAQRFAVSRVTVRDALRALEAIGLIDVRVGKSGGSFITAPATELVGQGLHNLLSMSEVSTRDKGEARLAVEISTIALAIARCDERDIEDLEALCRDHRAHLEAGQVGEGLSARFHNRIAEASRNRALLLMTRSFRGPLAMRSIRGEENTLETDARTVAEHEALTTAIRARDVSRAQHLMASHLLRNELSSAEAARLATEMRGTPTTDN